MPHRYWRNHTRTDLGLCYVDHKDGEVTVEDFEEALVDLNESQVVEIGCPAILQGGLVSLQVGGDVLEVFLALIRTHLIENKWNFKLPK